MEIRKVGVLGCGLMGSGIAQVAATAGFETIVKEVSDELIAKARYSIHGHLRRGNSQVARGVARHRLVG